jgi:hypothetical protein
VGRERRAQRQTAADQWHLVARCCGVQAHYPGGAVAFVGHDEGDGGGGGIDQQQKRLITRASSPPIRVGDSVTVEEDCQCAGLPGGPLVIGRGCGRSQRIIATLLKRCGGVRPAPWRRRELRLSLAEGAEISRGLAADLSFRAFATGLGRSPSTVSREVTDNGGCAGYRAVWSRSGRRGRERSVRSRASSRGYQGWLRWWRRSWNGGGRHSRSRDGCDEVRAVLLAGASDVLAAASRLDFLTMAEGLVVVARGAGKESAQSFPLSTYSAPGGLRQDPGRAAESLAEARICGNGSREVRVLLSTDGSRGDVEPLVGLAVGLRALGAEVRVCAPPDFAERLAGVGVPLVPVGQSARALTTGAPPPSSLPRHATELIAAQFDAVTAAAEGCDALVATGMMPAAAGARSRNWASAPCP